MRRWMPWPIALLTGACATRPWTPAASVLSSAEPAPKNIVIQMPSQLTAMERWLLPPGEAWSPWTKATLLSALDERPPPSPEQFPDVRWLDVVHRAEIAAMALARFGSPPRTLWLTDLRGAASVAFVATLSSRMPVAPVLTFNNWPADDEVVPAEETLAALLLYAPVLPAAGAPATPVFALDAWRLAYRDQDVGDATDNRYALTPSDFPSTTQLAALGIDRVVYLVDQRSDGEVEEDDLHAVLAVWAETGIAITMMDLATLSSDPRLEAYLQDHRYYPVPRDTILEDDSLHTRSPAGFTGGLQLFSGGGGG